MFNVVKPVINYRIIWESNRSRIAALISITPNNLARTGFRCLAYQNPYSWFTLIVPIACSAFMSRLNVAIVSVVFLLQTRAFIFTLREALVVAEVEWAILPYHHANVRLSSGGVNALKID